MNSKDQQFQEELRFGIKDVNLPSHLKSYRISPTSGNPAKFLNTSQTTVFEIGGDSCWNPSRLSLNFTRGSIPKLDNYYSAVPNFYCPYIERLELKSQDGTILVDVNNINAYSRLSSLLLNNFKENTQLNGMVYPTNSIVIDTAPTNLQGVDGYLENRSNLATLDNGTDLGVSAGTIVRASQYDWGVLGAGNNVGIIAAKNINISLQDLLPDSIFGCNKWIYTASNLYLRIQWAPYSSWLYRISGSNGAVFTSMSNAAADIDFLNLNLNMYVEANPLIAQTIKERYNTQQVLICPEIQSNNIVISNSAGYRSIMVKVLNSGDARLYKFYAGLASGNADNFYFTNNTSNYGNKKYDNVELYLNTLQLLNLSTTNNQDIEHTLQFYKNHSFSDLNSFKVISPFSHVFDCSPIEDKLYDGQTLRGIGFNNPQGEHSLQLRYNIVAPAANQPMNPNNQTTLNAFVFCVLLKPIYFFRGRIQLIPFS